MTDLAVIDALPDTGADRELLRALLVRDLVYFLSSDIDPQTFDPVDSETGAVVPIIAWQEQMFWYDSADSTTDHDAITCIVCVGGKRYKIAGFAVIDAAVLSRTETVPPDPDDVVEANRPSYGDAYLVPAGSSGDWATHADDIAVWTSRGWHYIPPKFGPPLYLRDEDAYVRWTGDDGWLDGLGNLVHSGGTIPLSSIIGADASAVMKVENQTTAAPPTTTGSEAGYIIPSGATGAWSGQTGKVARDEYSGQPHTIYTPATGDVVYDKALNGDYRWNGSAWVSAAGAIVNADRQFTAAALAPTRNGSTTTPYAYSATTAPTTSNRYSLDTTSFSYTAKKANAKLKIRVEIDVVSWAYQTSGTVYGASNPAVLALLRDSVTTAIAWCQIDQLTNGTGVYNIYCKRIAAEFYFDAPDTSAHSYKIAIFDASESGSFNLLYPSSIARRLIAIEEFA